MAVASTDVLTDYQVAVLNGSSNAFAQPLDLGGKFQSVQEDVVTLNADVVTLEADVAALEALAVATHSPVIAATTTTLPACTYANGTAGVGATLTGDANGALAAQDGVTLTAGQRLLVKDQAAPAQNGVYNVTVVGAGGAPFILTRATDFDTAAEIVDGATFFVGQGTALANSAFALTVNGAVVVGTTSLVFAQTGGVSFPGTQVAYATADGSKNKIPDAADTASAALDGLDAAMPVDALTALAAAADRITNTAVGTAFATTLTTAVGYFAVGTESTVEFDVLVVEGNAAETLTLEMQLDGNPIVTTAAFDVTDLGGDFIRLSCSLRCSGAGASGVVSYAATSNRTLAAGTNALVTTSGFNAAFDTTATHVFRVLATWSGASTANKADLRQAFITKRLAAAVT
jgi:hypothetical protein